MSETNVAAQITTSANTETATTPVAATAPTTDTATLLNTKVDAQPATEVSTAEPATANSEAKTDITFELKLAENSL